MKNETDTLACGALELARRIRSKKVSPLEVVELQISKIEKWNPKINALVEENFLKAKQQARKQTEEIQKNPKIFESQKLFGVPFTVKEMLAVNGFRRTAGNQFHGRPGVRHRRRELLPAPASRRVVAQAHDDGSRRRDARRGTALSRRDYHVHAGR